MRENVTDANNLRQLGKDIGLKMIVDKQTKIYSGGDMGDWDATLKLSKKLCDGLSEDDDGLKREILTHAGNRWSLGVLHALGTDGALRHGEIRRYFCEKITQRMLTRTLRQLERDGLISRYDYHKKPPIVVYEITSMGKEMLIRILPLWHWIITSSDNFREARYRYERRQN